MSNLKSSVIGRAKLANKPHFNPFDLSHRNVFTTSVGVLMPCDYHEVLPGEKFSVRNEFFTRAQTLVSNSYGRFIESVQSFYVPYSSIFREYPMRVLDSTQKNISGFNENRISQGIAKQPFTLSTRLPYFAISDIFRVCVLLDAYLYIAIRDKISGTSSLFTVTNSGLLRSVSIARHLMSLGYGDWTPFFVGSDYSLPFTDAVNLNINDALYGHHKLTGVRTLDFTKLDEIITCYRTNFQQIASPMRLFAYHKIYNDFYRNDVWQYYSANTCNLDYLTGQTQLYVSIPWLTEVYADTPFFNALRTMVDGTFESFSDLEKYIYTNIMAQSDAANILSCLSFFDERPLNLPIDAVNGVLPSPQYGSAAKVSITGVTTDTQLTSKGMLASNYNANYPSQNGKLIVTQGSASIDASLDFDVKDMRIAESLQKYKEISAANQNYFVDQIKAHFGADYARDPFITKFLGGTSNVIQVDTQINQNLGDDNNATLGGIASAQGNYSCNGVADDYGIVITLHGIYPIVDYPNIGMDSQVLSVYGSDIPVPEFDNNGFEGRRLIGVLGNLRSRYTTGESPSSVYGYASRFFDYKTSKDVVNGAFLTTMKDKVMAVNTLNDNTVDLIQRTLYASPFMCDTIFANTNHSTIDDDQFYTNMNCGFAITRPFSVHSLPYAN